MELISKEVVRRIIDSGRTREQMLAMVDSAVAVDSSTNCIRRSDMLDAIGHGTTYTSGELQEIVKRLPSVKPKEITGEWQQGEIDWYKLGKCIEEGFRKGLEDGK